MAPHPYIPLVPSDLYEVTDAEHEQVARLLVEIQKRLLQRGRDSDADELVLTYEVMILGFELSPRLVAYCLQAMRERGWDIEERKQGEVVFHLPKHRR
ncbi:MAG: hypothetical protein HY429_00865 [Candidatus Levybacteria bacterium]|nr:hypothetical protein [Candidatus Levybacteria bacterium]